MNQRSKFLHFIIILFELSPLVLAQCGKYEYLNKKTLNCQACSQCSEPLVIIAECTNSSDIVCAISDFEFLSEIDDTVLEEGPVATVRKNDSEHWKKLAFSLIGALCVLAVIATVIVFISCRRYLQCTSEKYKDTSTLDQRGENEGESEYVVIRRPTNSIVTMTNEQSRAHPLSGVPHIHHGRYHRLSRIYRPKRRLMNEYVDDVFESEDSGGSRTGTRLPLHTIPERSDSEGCEN